MAKQPRVPFGVRTFERLGQTMRMDAHRAFVAFLPIVACAVSGGQREAEYMQLIQHIEKPALMEMSLALAELVEAMEAKPYVDQLGPIHMETGSKSSQSWGGEFYTPADVCKMIAQVTMSVDLVPLDRPMEVLEPACGGGQMVLAAADFLHQNNISPLCMRVTCVDVSRIACDVCYINMCLWGIPGVVIHGNTLSLEEWGRWPTPFWNMAQGRSGALAPFIRAIDLMREVTGDVEPTSLPTIETVAAAITDKKGQMLMTFDEVAS